MRTHLLNMEFKFTEERYSVCTCCQHDYLLFKYTQCPRSFCPFHRMPSSHSCPAKLSSAKRLACRQCGQVFWTLSANSSAHPERMAYSAHAKVCQKRHVSGKKCAFRECGKRILASIRCPHCNKGFCVERRTQGDLMCEVRGNSTVVNGLEESG